MLELKIYLGILKNKEIKVNMDEAAQRAPGVAGGTDIFSMGCKF